MEKIKNPGKIRIQILEKGGGFIKKKINAYVYNLAAVKFCLVLYLLQLWSACVCGGGVGGGSW